MGRQDRAVSPQMSLIGASFDAVAATIEPNDHVDFMCWPLVSGLTWPLQLLPGVCSSFTADDSVDSLKCLINIMLQEAREEPQASFASFYHRSRVHDLVSRSTAYVSSE